LLHGGDVVVAGRAGWVRWGAAWGACVGVDDVLRRGWQCGAGVTAWLGVCRLGVLQRRWAQRGWWLWAQGCRSSGGCGVGSVMAGAAGWVCFGGCCGGWWWHRGLGVRSHRVHRAGCCLPACPLLSHPRLPHGVSSVQSPTSKSRACRRLGWCAPWAGSMAPPALPCKGMQQGCARSRTLSQSPL